MKEPFARTFAFALRVGPSTARVVCPRLRAVSKCLQALCIRQTTCRAPLSTIKQVRPRQTRQLWTEWAVCGRRSLGRI
ncbi:hypothetical protein DPEC_G00161910 [Dallia pectoralis]|uniref:Uncharacterized protein n=1 Tax=Dallia pectoralis TaxID=75939 RepID=A0ACC2GGV1_DALPE|nr:hypothetical protein DPEC_G00161910 [Dallia pectoralis]